VQNPAYYIRPLQTPQALKNLIRTTRYTGDLHVGEKGGRGDVFMDTVKPRFNKPAGTKVVVLCNRAKFANKLATTICRNSIRTRLGKMHVLIAKNWVEI
jgi:hypothetical protein